jgi:hypothetical protein
LIDNAAHLGGLVLGAMLALVVGYRRPGERSGIAITWRVLQITAIALVAVSFFKTAQHFKDPLPQFLVEQSAREIQPTEPENAAYLSYAKAMTEAQIAFGVAMRDRDTSNIDDAVKNLEAAPRLDQEADVLRERLKLLLLRTKQPQETAVASPQRRANKSGQKSSLTQEFFTWQREYNQWLKTRARDHSGLKDLTLPE